MKDFLVNALNDLYRAFNGYDDFDPKNVGCFDFGPSQKVIEDLSGDLRNIPDSALVHMEFHGGGWDSWGSKIDVGYLLPRLMQFIAEDVGRLQIGGIFSLFTCKLNDFFLCSSVDWNSDEKLALRNFMEALLKERASIDTDLGLLIEMALVLKLDLTFLISNWRINNHRHKEQMVFMLIYFGCNENGESDLIGEYFNDSEVIQGFINSMLSQVSQKEISYLFSIVGERTCMDKLTF